MGIKKPERLLVRGPDFNRRFEARIESLGVSSLVSPDITNLARLMERQRLYSSVAASNWGVVHKNGDIPIITNDLGYTTFGNPNTGDSGIAVPLGLDHILCLSPKLKKVLVYGINGVWLPNIEYVESPRDDHLGFNHAITRLSQRFIFGPDRQSIEIFLPKQKTETLPVPEPGQTILKRDHYTCQACGAIPASQVHHIRPRRQGGSDTPSNLITLCGRCPMLISPVPAFVLWKVYRIQEKDIQTEREKVEIAIQEYLPPQA